MVVGKVRDLYHLQLVIESCVKRKLDVPDMEVIFVEQAVLDNPGRQTTAYRSCLPTSVGDDEVIVAVDEEDEERDKVRRVDCEVEGEE